MADVDAFVNESVVSYKLDVTRYATAASDAYKEYLADHPNVKVIIATGAGPAREGESPGDSDDSAEEKPAFAQVYPLVNWEREEILAVS